MANYLTPLVNELNQLEKGNSWIKSQNYPLGSRLFIRLLCIACDIPAARKIAGFKGFNAKKGCSKCNCEFPRRIGIIY